MNSEQGKVYTIAMVKTAEELITELRAIHSNDFKTRDDVSAVLDHIGAPGDFKDLKREVVSQLFPRKSPQGYSTADDLDSYAEY